MFTLVITQGESCEKCRKNGKDRDPQKKRKKFVEIDRGVFGFFELLKVRKIAVRETGAAEFLRQKKDTATQLRRRYRDGFIYRGSSEPVRSSLRRLCCNRFL